MILGAAEPAPTLAEARHLQELADAGPRQGGCPDCRGWTEVLRGPTAWHHFVHHDDTCPVFTAMRRRARPMGENRA